MNLTYRIEATCESIVRKPTIRARGIGYCDSKLRKLMKQAANNLVHEHFESKIVVYRNGTADIMDIDSGEVLQSKDLLQVRNYLAYQATTRDKFNLPDDNKFL
ncbi:hypothetical protein HN747_02130 [archaeon]|jgi:hypothetical protein|nr:hypothetical protein [archaeon]